MTLHYICYKVRREDDAIEELISGERLNVDPIEI